MKLIFQVLNCVLLLFLLSCRSEPPVQLKSGIDLEAFNHSIRPQDDFYEYVNGSWIEKAVTPDDQSFTGSFRTAHERTQQQLKVIIKQLLTTKYQEHTDTKRVSDFYKSYMNEEQLEALKLSALKSDFVLIDDIKSKRDLIKAMAKLHRQGVTIPIHISSNVDDKDAAHYILNIYQSGLGMGSREYYTDESQQGQHIKAEYLKYIYLLFELAKMDDMSEKAKKVMHIEESLAQGHWTKVQNRDPEKSYNFFKVPELQKLTPGFNWIIFFDESGTGPVVSCVVRQVEYLQHFGKLFNQFSLKDWKLYLKWQLLNTYAGALTKKFDDASFNFRFKTLRGLQKKPERWKRGLHSINRNLGTLLGKEYVKKHFKAETKKRLEVMVDYIRSAMRDRIRKLDWMSSDTKVKALEKLSKLSVKIAYPDKWKSYDGLELNANHYLENIKKIRRFEFDRNINKQGKKVDKSEWFISPQIVNAYYNPSMNEIVFPAAILQAPFFDKDADEAINYGAIGCVIAHEITHGFDDQGRKYDGDGQLKNWWTDADVKKFKEKSDLIVLQYDAFKPFDDLSINGELTLGENIADLGGVSIAFEAYHRSLEGRTAKKIDNFTGDQRFFIGYATVWKGKAREQSLRRLIKVDPHSPPKYRVNGPLSNMKEFYRIFNVKEGDGMYRDKKIRVTIW